MHVHSIHPVLVIAKQSKLQSSGSFGHPAMLAPTDDDVIPDDDIPLDVIPGDIIPVDVIPGDITPVDVIPIDDALEVNDELVA